MRERAEGPGRLLTNRFVETVFMLPKIIGTILGLVAVGIFKRYDLKGLEQNQKWTFN